METVVAENPLSLATSRIVTIGRIQTADIKWIPQSKIAHSRCIGNNQCAGSAPSGMLAATTFQPSTYRQNELATVAFARLEVSGEFAALSRQK